MKPCMLFRRPLLLQLMMLRLSSSLLCGCSYNQRSMLRSFPFFATTAKRAVRQGRRCQSRLQGASGGRDRNDNRKDFTRLIHDIVDDVPRKFKEKQELQTENSTEDSGTFSETINSRLGPILETVRDQIRDRFDKDEQQPRPNTEEIFQVFNDGTVQPLIANSLGRAQSRLSQNQAIKRQVSTASGKAATEVNLEPLMRDIEENVPSKEVLESLGEKETKSNVKDAKPPNQGPCPNELSYHQNPAISSTALAHALWGHVLRPGVDSAIDATSGNGADAQQLARLLQLDVDDTNQRSSHLVCIDIQEQACDATRRALEQVVSSSRVFDEQVHIIQSSHAPLLPLVHAAASASLGLVAFNLGFLPTSTKQVQTQADSTLEALVDACTILRVGGLLSVLTYPSSNLLEHQVVQRYVEALALLSSKSEDWRQYLQSLEFHDDIEGKNKVKWKLELTEALGRVLSANGHKQTWRVHETRKLGWKDAPTLYTAIRIK